MGFEVVGNVDAIPHMIRRRQDHGSPRSRSSAAIGGVVSSNRTFHDAKTLPTLARVAFIRGGWPRGRIAQRRDTLPTGGPQRTSTYVDCNGSFPLQGKDLRQREPSRY